MDKFEFIARVRFIGWICYQIASKQTYNEHPTHDQLESLINGVKFALSNPDATAEDNHENWMKSKLSQGWKYGKVRSLEDKTNPDLVPFDELNQTEKDKDIMDLLVTRLANELYGSLTEK